MPFQEFEQVQRTCVESYLAKRKFHVQLSTRYLCRYGLARLMLLQGGLQNTSEDDSDGTDDSWASDLADLANHFAEALANPPSTVPGVSADKSTATAGSSTGAAASAHSAATAGSSTGAAEHAQAAAALSPTSPAQLPLT